MSDSPGQVPPPQQLDDDDEGAIRRGDVTHRRWMLRTFAMTHAAVTLRLCMLVLVPWFGGDFLRA